MKLQKRKIEILQSVLASLRKEAEAYERQVADLSKRQLTSAMMVETREGWRTSAESFRSLELELATLLKSHPLPTYAANVPIGPLCLVRSSYVEAFEEDGSKAPIPKRGASEGLTWLTLQTQARTPLERFFPSVPEIWRLEEYRGLRVGSRREIWGWGRPGEQVRVVERIDAIG
jgi:hypothetical protein